MRSGKAQLTDGYVVVREGHTVTEAALLEHARDHIARFKVPDYVVFREDLPRTATGKVTKAVLRALDDIPVQPQP